jgi:putative ABC transport system permease protein
MLALLGDRIPMPRLEQVALDLPVVMFTLVTALATGIIFGLAPAFVSTTHVGDAYRDAGRHGGGRGLHRMLGALVVSEVALSLVLLAGAGLLLRSFLKLQNVDPGFRAERVLTASVQLPRARYPDPRADAFYQESLSRISALPGVENAAAAKPLPLAGSGTHSGFHRIDRPNPAGEPGASADIRPVTPGFFRTLGIPELTGRDVAFTDTPDSPPVAIVSASVVARYFGDENPLGKRLSIFVYHANGRADMEWVIVGVVGDVKMSSLDAAIRPAIYLPRSQLGVRDTTFVVRTTQEPLSIAASLRSVVQTMDPEVTVANVRTLEAVVGNTIARPHVITMIVVAFAMIALMLAGVGVYSVMAYSVLERTQEIGIRMALGATTQSVFRLMIGRGLRLVFIGVAIGLVAAGILTRLLERLLYDVEPLDPWTFGMTALILLVVAMSGSYIPARRGMRVVPVDALRTK